MKKKLHGWWKKTIPALFLAISIVLLLQDISSASGWRRSRYIDADNKKWNFYTYTTTLIQGKKLRGDAAKETIKGLRCYWNEIMYRHNSCGFYRSHWDYLGGAGPSSVGMYFARVVVGTTVFLLFFLPMLFWNFWILAAVLPTLWFVCVLMLAVEPGYWGVLFLVAGLLALRLVRKNQWKEQKMPRVLVYTYGILFALLFATPWILPDGILPAHPAELKASITTVLEQAKLMEGPTADPIPSDLVEKPTEARPEQDDEVPNDPGTKESDAWTDETDAQGSNPFLNGSLTGKSPANGGWSESGGRADQTGRLQFQNIPVATVYSREYPNSTQYLRLYAGENWWKNRWIVNGGAAEWTQASATYSWEDDGAQHDIYGYPRETAESAEYIQDCLEVPEELRAYFQKEFPELKEAVNGKTLTGQELSNAISRTQKLLSDRAYYTFNPGSPDTKLDFVEWFLEKAKKGYCVHFASAGVLLMRYQGIPARYAEGYAVPANQWIQMGDNLWQAEAMDYQGHAWPEAYDAGRKQWIVAEVTPAYDTGVELWEIAKVESERIARRWRIAGGIIGGILGTLVLAAAIFVGADKLRAKREYRRMHTGSTRKDIRYMFDATLHRMQRVGKKKRKKGYHLVPLELNPENQSQFLEQARKFLQEADYSEEVCDSFEQLARAGYRAAFARRPDKEERDAAEVCYRQVKHALTPPIEIRIWRRTYRFRV